MALFNIIDLIIFIIFACNIVYLAIFSVSSLFHERKTEVNEVQKKRIAILIPSYKEDEVIGECVASCMAQEYPKELYDTIVISDRMTDETNEKLSQLPIILHKVYFENSTKSKALNSAMEAVGDSYDIAIVLDADNIIPTDYLSRINTKFSSDTIKIVQSHRCAKNINTPLAMLDAMSEEINNSIFRKGHANLGLSAALIGSGMAFSYTLFKTTMLKIDAVGGFDRALELNFLYDKVRIHYMDDLRLLDEKVQRSSDFSRQRRRWLSAQLHYLKRSLPAIPKAIMDGKWDFCDKVFQQMSIPRIILVGFCFVIATVLSFIDIGVAIKWWYASAAVVLALTIAIPKSLMNIRLLLAVAQLPYFFVLMVLNLFKLRGANKKFIHTKHGVK